MRFEKLTTSYGSSSRSSCWFVTNPASISISTTSPRSAWRIFCKHRRSSSKHAPWQNYTDSCHTTVLQFYSHHTRQPLVYNQRILLVQDFTAHIVLLVASATTAFWLGRNHLRSTDTDTCIVSVPVLDVYIMCIKSVKRECSSKQTSTYYLSICHANSPGSHNNNFAPLASEARSHHNLTSHLWTWVCHCPSFSSSTYFRREHFGKRGKGFVRAG